MLGNLVVWLVGFVLRRNLTAEQRNNIVVHILGTLQAVPLSAIIDVNEAGQIVGISGRTLDIEKVRQLQDGALAAVRNPTLKLIREQVVYEAYVGAATKAATPLELLFYKAALWWGQQEEKYLLALAQIAGEPDL